MICGLPRWFSSTTWFCVRATVTSIICCSLCASEGDLRESRNERGEEDRDHRRSERRRKDDVRTGVPAARGRLPSLHQCGFDRGRTVAVRSGRCGVSRGAFDARGDRPQCCGWHQLRVRDDVVGTYVCAPYRSWRSAGFVVKLLFLSLRNADEAIARVALRVEQGGHHVPPEVVRRRFMTGMKNFMDVYRFEVDYWRLFDN